MLLTAHTVLDIRAIMTFIMIVSSCGNHLTHTHRPHWSETDTGYVSADSSPGTMVSPYLYTSVCVYYLTHTLDSHSPHVYAKAIVTFSAVG